MKKKVKTWSVIHFFNWVFCHPHEPQHKKERKEVNELKHSLSYLLLNRSTSRKWKLSFDFKVKQDVLLKRQPQVHSNTHAARFADVSSMKRKFFCSFLDEKYTLACGFAGGGRHSTS